MDISTAKRSLGQHKRHFNRAAEILTSLMEDAAKNTTGTVRCYSLIRDALKDVKTRWESVQEAIEKVESAANWEEDDEEAKTFQKSCSEA